MFCGDIYSLKTFLNYKNTVSVGVRMTTSDIGVASKLPDVFACCSPIENCPPCVRKQAMALNTEILVL
jgi:hypothetical protein